METGNKLKIPVIFLSVVSGILLIINIFTAYLYINTKSDLTNKILKSAEYKEKMELLQSENKQLNTINKKYVAATKDNGILNSRVEQLTKENTELSDELEQTNSEKAIQSTPVGINQSVKANNPPNTITTGSDKEHVKKVMGTPTNIVLTSWWYGQESWISFDDNGLVDGWYDGGKNLKLK